MRDETVKKSAHFFNNCRAAFRLMQGALLSGHFNVPDSKKKILEERMVTLETGTYSSSDPELNDVQTFFLNLSNLTVTSKPKIKGQKAVELKNQKIIIFDDQYESCGWKEVFELIFPAKNIIAIKSFQEAANEIKFAKIKSSVVAIFVDINLDTTKDKNNKSDGKEGFQLIKEISHSYPQIPIVAFSAYESAILAKKAFEDGAWDYFAKEPKTEEVKEYRDALDYYLEFLRIIQKYQVYNENYIQYWSMIDSLEKKMTSNIPADFKDNILKNLRTGYMFLCMEDSIRFIPSLWNLNKSEMVITQSSKALDTFCAYLINHLNLPLGTTNKPTLGTKIGIMENNAQKQESLNWLKRASKLNTDRNNTIHETEYSRSKSTFVISTQLGVQIGKDFFVKTVHLITEGTKFIS